MSVEGKQWPGAVSSNASAKHMLGAGGGGLESLTHFCRRKQGFLKGQAEGGGTLQTDLATTNRSHDEAAP